MAAFPAVTKDSVYKAAEALRRALAAWTGERWLYAAQDATQELPIGVIQVISSAPQGRGWRVIEDGKEAVYKNMTVVVQASFIEDSVRGADAAKTIFRPSSVLHNISAALHLTEFQYQFRKAAKDLETICSILSVGEVRPEAHSEDIGLFVPASADIDLNVWAKILPPDPAPCVTEAELPALKISLSE